jgi:uncharacterized protein (TIGR02285 family)
MNTRRSMINMRKNSNICVISRIKTPSRSADFLFSTAVNMYLSRRLYIHADANSIPTSFIEGDNVDLVKLLTYKKNKSIILSEDISYGKALDALIYQVPSNRKILRAGMNNNDEIFTMLLKQRADYYLGFPQQFGENALKNKNLLSYAILHTPPYVVGHFICTNNADIKLVINKINKILALFHYTVVTCMQRLKFAENRTLHYFL